MAVAVAALLLGGCYTYSPVNLADVRPGANVRARISAEGARAVVAQDPRALHEANRPYIQGSILEVHPEGLVLLVAVGVVDVASGPQTLNRRLAIATVDIRRLELRRIDHPRTALAVTLGLITAGFLVYAGLDSEGN